MMLTKIKLESPIQHGQELISELELRKPKAKDLRDLPLEFKMGDLIDLAGTLSAQPQSVMDKLDVSDTMKV